MFLPNETSQTIDVTILDDNEPEPAEVFTVVLSGVAGAELVDPVGQGTINDDDGTMDFCGEPTYSSTTDRATFLWKDCVGSGRWELRVTGGVAMPPVVYDGEIEFSGGSPQLQTFRLEPNDSLQVLGGPTRIDYLLRTWNIDQDGFSFADGAGCFRPMAPDRPIYIGASRTLLQTADMDLSTGAACQ